MGDSDDDFADDLEKPLHLEGDRSYQSAPADGFENSRAEGVVAFKRGLEDLGHKQPAASGPSGGLFAAWSDEAAFKGSRPLDFSFLMPPGGAGAKAASDKDSAISAMSDDEGSAATSAANSKRHRKGTATEESSRPESLCGARKPLPAPPCPAKRPATRLFGKVVGENRGENLMDPPAVRTDVYSWMRCPDGGVPEESKALMADENAYAELAQEHLQPLREQLYKEMMGHQRETDQSLLTLYPGGYGYFTRHFAGKSYQKHFRRKAIQSGWGEEEFVLDENEIARDPESGQQRPYSSVSGPDHNPSHTLFVYATDFVGNDSYTLHVRPFGDAPNPHAQVAIATTDGSVSWNLTGDAFYYVTLDHEFRQHRVKCHVLGQDPTGAADLQLFEEADQKFWACVSCTGCSRYLVITAMSADSSEDHLLDLSHPQEGLRRVSPRVFGHSYGTDHRSGMLYLLTNKDGVKDSKLCRAPLAALPDIPLQAWEDMWVPPEGTKLESHACFSNFLVLSGRERGQCRIFVHGYGEPGNPPFHSVAFPDAALHTGHVLTPRGAQAAEATFSAGLDSNEIFDTRVLRYSYSSFTVPGLAYEYDVMSREHNVLRKEEIPNFDPDAYRSERLTTPLRKVPISLVYRKDIHPRGLAGGPFPMLITGYGAYGACQDPDFDGNRLSLLDRGMVYAIVHVRGGGEFGAAWHEEGRNLKVKNRFADFVDAAETLISLRVTAANRLTAWGTSSGGLLVTGAVNLRPDLFRAVLLEVPFCDALNTMSDPSIPLTVQEWDEVGNTNQREYFYYVSEYSPYENIRMEAYPAVLATASLNDSMVGYWEPLKYISKLRALKTDPRVVLLRTDFHAGHGGGSDRYQGAREAAFHFAFLLDQLGLANGPCRGRWS